VLSAVVLYTKKMSFYRYLYHRFRCHPVVNTSLTSHNAEASLTITTFKITLYLKSNYILFPETIQVIANRNFDKRPSIFIAILLLIIIELQFKLVNGKYWQNKQISLIKVFKHNYYLIRGLSYYIDEALFSRRTFQLNNDGDTHEIPFLP